MLSDYDFDQEFKDSKTWVFLDKLSKSKAIEWCSGDEAIPFQEYLWFRDYAGLKDLMDLHVDFLDPISSDDTFFLLSESQLSIIQQI